MKKWLCAFLLLPGVAAAQQLCPANQYNFNGQCLNNPVGVATIQGQTGTGVGGKGGGITLLGGVPAGASTATGDVVLFQDPGNPAVTFTCSQPTTGNATTATCTLTGVTLSTSGGGGTFPPSGMTYTASPTVIGCGSTSVSCAYTIQQPASAVNFLQWRINSTGPGSAHSHWWQWTSPVTGNKGEIQLNAADDSQTNACFPVLDFQRAGGAVGSPDVPTVQFAAFQGCSGGSLSGSYSKFKITNSADVFVDMNLTTAPVDYWVLNDCLGGCGSTGYTRFNESSDNTNYLTYSMTPASWSATPLLTNGFTSGAFASVYTRGSAPLQFGTNTIAMLGMDASQNAFWMQPTATTDTNGFEYQQSVAGTPTGVPASTTGLYANSVPMRFDTFHNELWAYNTAWVPASGIMNGLTGSIGGGLLSAGACASGTASVTGAVVGQVATANPNTYPGDGAEWEAYVSGSSTVTVKVCAIVALTPTASTYNVRVIP